MPPSFRGWETGRSGRLEWRSPAVQSGEALRQGFAVGDGIMRRVLDTVTADAFARGPPESEV